MPNHVSNLIVFEGDNSQITRLLDKIVSKSGEDGREAIDFNLLLPMPKDLEIESSSHTSLGIRMILTEISPFTSITAPNAVKVNNQMYENLLALLNRNQFFPVKPFSEEELAKEKERFEKSGQDITRPRELGLKAIGNVIKYGATTWYDWCCENWGTKWNAYDNIINREDNTVCFHTAWSMPCGFLHALVSLLRNEEEVFSNLSFTWTYADEDCGNNTGEFVYDCDTQELTGGEFEFCSSDAYKAFVTTWGETDCIGQDENGNYIHYDCDTCPNKCR